MLFFLKNIFIEIKNLRKIALRDFGYLSCVVIKHEQITLLSLKLQFTQILIQTVANCLLQNMYI